MKDLPEEWEAGIGERNKGKYYTKFFYNPRRNLELRIEWDKGHDHTVVLRDTEVDEFLESKHAYTEEEAEKKALSVMRRYQSGLWEVYLTKKYKVVADSRKEAEELVLGNETELDFRDVDVVSKRIYE